MFSALLVTTCWAIGAYTVYTYVSPFLTVSAGLSPTAAGVLLMLLGAAAMGGIAIGGAANDRIGSAKVHAIGLPLLAATFAGLTLAAFALAPHALPVLVPLIVLWGLGAWSFFPPQQDRLIRLVGVGHAPVILSLNASFMYVGFSVGAAFGSLVISAGSVRWIGAAGAFWIVVAALISNRLRRRG